jgi:YfiH family protein
LIETGFQIEKKGHSPSWVSQVHGADCIFVKDRSENASYGTALPEADAVVTSAQDKEIWIYTADCIPVLVEGRGEEKKIGAIHSGWRGTMKGIVSKVRREHFNDGARWRIGPAIGPCCFAVREDFIETFRSVRGNLDRFLKKDERSWKFDLISFLVAEELSGVKPEDIDMTEFRCTHCSMPKLPSYRREGNTDHRIRAWIRMRTQNPG